MQKYVQPIILALLATVLGCSGIEVSQDFDPATSLSGLKTYDWKSGTQEKTGDVRTDNPLLDARIRAAVDRSLSERGYQRVSNRTPDFYVGYQYTVRSKVGSDDAGIGVGFGIGSFGSHGGIGISSGSGVSEYDEGTLVIDFIDPSNSDLIWRGTGTRRVSQHSDPEKRTKNINETVDKILAQFPPKLKR